MYYKDIKDWSLPNEVWKKIDIEEGLELYEVSNLGRVRGYLFRGKPQPRILPQNYAGAGYLTVFLNLKKGGRKSFYVHRLVAYAFNEGYADKLVINHLDEDKSNNVHTNLEWTTQALNLEHNDIRSKNATKIRNNKTRSKPVIATNIKTGEKIKFLSTMDAERKGFVSSNVAACARGDRKTHKGYTWEYVEEEES